MRKYFRYGLFLALVLFTSSTFALTSKYHKFNGFYIGVDGGVDSWNLQTTIDYFDSYLSLALDLPVTRQDTNVGRLGFSGGLFTGYAFVEGKTYGSLEINLDVLSNKHNVKNILAGYYFTPDPDVPAVPSIGSLATDFVVSEKQQWAGSIDFHGGYIFSHVALVYITAGYSMERFKSEASSTAIVIDTTFDPLSGTTTATTTSSSGAYNTVTNISAFRIGLGSEYALNRQWRIRSEAFGKIYANKPYFLSDLTGVQLLTANNTIGAKRNYMGYYLGILRQF